MTLTLRTRETNDKRASMHDASCIGIRTTLTESHVFQVIPHVVGLVAVCAEIPIHLLSKHQNYSLLACMRIPCRHTAKINVRGIVFTPPLPSVAAHCRQL